MSDFYWDVVFLWTIGVRKELFSIADRMLFVRKERALSIWIVELVGRLESQRACSRMVKYFAQFRL